MERLLLTTVEACELLGIGETTLYRLRKQGLIPYVELPSGRGNCNGNNRSIIRYRYKDLLDYVNDNTVSVNAK